jgi:hypothetical protein
MGVARDAHVDDLAIDVLKPTVVRFGIRDEFGVGERRARLGMHATTFAKSNVFLR